MRRPDSSFLRSLWGLYGDVIENIIENTTKNTFIFCRYVNGSGALVLSKLLEKFGFRKSNGLETTPAKRYLLLTSLNPNIPKLIERF